MRQGADCANQASLSAMCNENFCSVPYFMSHFTTLDDGIGQKPSDDAGADENSGQSYEQPGSMYLVHYFQKSYSGCDS